MHRKVCVKKTDVLYQSNSIADLIKDFVAAYPHASKLTRPDL